MLVAAPAALAQDATWLTTPASNDFNAPGNWTPGAVPGGLATFGTSSITTLTFSASRRIDGFIFDPGAPGYTFDLSSGFSLRFQADGIINHSANAPTFNVSNSPLIFDDSSTAGNAIINLNAGTVQFLNSSTAGTAQLNAATGTTFDFTGTLGPASNGVFSAGSISGAGNFDLGAGNRLVVGSNDLSTTVSGTIVSGAITKVGAGTLTLSGSNTYTGGTTLSSGALMIGNSSALGSGDLSMAQGTTLAFDTVAAYDVVNNIGIAGDPIFDVAAGPSQTISGVISDTDPVNNPGIVEKNGAGTLILSGANTYSGGTTINAGTLQVTNSTPGTSSSVGIGDVTLSGGTFQADGSTNLTFANNFKINSAGGAVDNSGTILTLSGVVSNGNVTTGVLQLTDSVGLGTTVLAGANTYSGGTTVVATTVQVTNSTPGVSSSVGTGMVTLDAAFFRTDGLSNLTFANNFTINNGSSIGSTFDNAGTTLTLSGVIGNGTVDINGRFGSVTFMGSGRTILTGDNPYTGGTTICFCSTLQLGTSVKSGSLLGAVANEGIFDIVNANTSGITTVANEIGAYTIFRNSTDAGTMIIDNQTGGSVEFRQTSSAAGATINNNISASTKFFNSSTAGNATINNLAGFGVGVVEFNTLSKAGTATINNAGNSWVVFNDRTTLENAKIVNSDAGLVLFNSQSTAGAALASISNNDDGQVHFLDRSKAGSATITNNDFGALDFNSRASADNATIVNNSAFGMDFFDQSTAGNAFITTTSNSGGTFFWNRSDGGTARFETEAGSIVDFSGSRGPNADGKINAGSIAGAGDYFIGGGNTLSVGGNNLSTEVSGVIADSCGCNPGPGALTKVGTGTLTLSGTNTYTGGTTITAGTLQLGNGTDMTGSILGNVTDNATLAFNRPNAYQFNGVISGSGAVQQNGAGTTTLTAVNSYGGGTTINAGKLSIAADANLGASTGALTFNGGTLQFTNAAALTLSNTRAITLLGGGGGFEVTSGNVVVNQAIGGSGALTKSGSGFLVLTGSNTYSGGTTISAGTLVLGIGGATGSISGDVVDNGLLTFNRSDSFSFDGNISGSGGMTKFGAGTLTLTADNTYSSGTVIAAGTLQLGNGGTTGTVGSNTLNDGGSLVFNRSNLLAFGAQISGSGGVTQLGTGTTVLTGTNTYNGGTTITAGTLQLGNGATTGSIVGDVANNATLAFNRSNAYQFDGVISGSGAVQQNGAGTTTLTAVNTYAGATTISAGTLALSGAGSIANSSGVTANGIFDISATTAGASIKNLSGTGNVTLGGQTLTLTNASGTFAGAIGGTGGLIKQGAGLFTLSGTNTYGGATTVAGGELRVNGSVASTVNVQSGATLSGIGSVGGLVTIQFGGTLSAGQSPGTLTLGALNLNAGSTSVFELGSAGVVGGASNDLVNITGNLTLGGTLSVNAPSAGYYRLFNYGTLTASSFDAINGSSNGTATVLTNVSNQVNLLIAGAGQRIQFWDGADQTGNGVVNGGAGTWNAANTNWTGAPGQAGINDSWRSSVGVFAGTAGTVTIAGAQAFDTLQFSSTGYVLNAGAGGQLQLAGSSGAGSINTDNGVAATIDAPIVNGSSTSLTKVGGGTLILTGANTYSGGTTISGGVLQIGNGGNTGSIVGNVTDNGILAINRSDTFTFSGAISGSGAFQQLGTGTTILTADNNYSGGTTISAGTLQVGNGGTTGSMGAGNIIDNASLVFDRSNTYTVANSISGTGSLAQIGSSTVFLTGNNTYTGGTTINSGELSIGASGTGTTGSIVGDVAVATSAQLWFNRSDSIAFDGSISGSGLVAKFGSGVLTLTGTNTYTGGTVISDGTLQLGNGGTAGSLAGNVSVLGSAASLSFNRSDTYVFGGFIDGPGSVSQIGTGKTILTANNAYNGGTTISAGTLQLGNGGATGSIVGNVIDNGVFAVNHSNAFTFGGTISGSGAFQQIGTGTTILTADNTYSGGTTISAGTLQLGNGGTTGSIVGDVLNNSVLTINRSNALMLGGVISGTGTLSQIGSGTTTLGGANTYTGATTISNGTLVIAAGGSITSDVTNNATFNNSGLVAGGVANIATFNNNAGGIVSGLLTNTAGTTTNFGQLNGGANVTGGVLTNNNLISGAVGISDGGTLNNNLTIAGAVTNAATFNNNANGTVSGLVTNNGGTTTNAGQLNGGATVTGGVLTNNNLISGAVGISGGGTLNNNQTIAGAVTNAATFNNNANGTVSGLVTNNGGTTTNAGQLNGGANVSGGTLTNNNLISGAVANSGSLNNNLTISGVVTNASIFNNNAGGAVSGVLTNTGGTTINAGRLNGGASVTGGALTTTGTILNGLTNNAVVNAAGGTINGAIANNAGGTFNVLGTVTSDNIFTNAANAVLAIGASGAYTLQGMLTNSGAVTVANGGQLIATVGGITNNAGGTITVALGGTVKDDLSNAGAIANNGAYVANVATNTGAGSITNAATGTWSGKVLSNAAAITNNGGWTGNVASNTGTIDNNKTWTGTVSNAGAFNNNAGATVSGLLTNTAGTTVNNGALNGGANISGGTFTGSGTVANLTVSGGVFAPGNGTPGSSMTVTGNLAFQSGALYLVALNPTAASFASVGGAASLNGAAAAGYLAGNYISKKYTILTAAGGVSGTFGSLVNTNVPTNFTSSLSYDANNAYINLTLNFVPNPAPNFGSGLNINQQNVANTLINFFNSTGGIPAVFGSLSPGGLTQASGEPATASQQTSFDAMNLFLGLLTDPFVAGRGAPVAPSTLAPQFADESDANAYASTGKPRTKKEREAYAAVARKAPMRDAVYDPRWSVWAAGFGGSQTTDGNVALGSNTATSRVFGTAVGADYLFSPRTLAGFALAGGGTNFSVNGLGTGRSDLFQAGAFVRHTNGPAYISAALAYGWQDVTTDRTVAGAGGGQLRATFNANAFSGRLEGGYRFVTPWMAVGLTPYAAGQFTTFDLPAYAEQAITGANMFALGYASKDVTASRSEFGLRSDKSFAMPDGIFTLRGRAAWAHNFNPDRNIAATFQTLPGASFVVNGAAQASDSALVTASAEMKWLNGFSLGATFEGEFSDVTRSYAGKGVVRYAW